MDQTAAEQLRQVFSDLESRTRAGEWAGLDDLAHEQDRLLRLLLAHPDEETVAYLQAVCEDHAKLLELVAAARDEVRDQLKQLANGRKAVTAYR